MNTQPLSNAYSNLLYELFNTKKKYISPYIFKEIIGLLNPLFKGIDPVDPKDFIIFIIEKLHQELNSSNIQENSQIDFSKKEENSKNEIIMLQLFIKDFNLKNNSIISQIFYGITRSTLTCKACNQAKYSFQGFNVLIFQLKKVKEEKKKMLGEYYNNCNEKLNLIDAFDVEQRMETFDGDNMIYCNNCHELRIGLYQKKIYRLPSVLIIILYRGKNNEYYKEEFDFPLILDFTHQGIIINPESLHKFYLFGIISDIGKNSLNRHYIAYCRSGPNSQFFCYNDALVFPVSNEEALKTNISSTDNEKKIPYILFYHNF